MKRIALLLLLLLAACAERIPPTSALTAPPAPTETPVPPTATKVDVRNNIPAEVGQAAGGETYQGLVESIGENGEIRATDYESGRAVDYVITPETVQVTQTADWRFKQIVTAEAKSKYGKEVILLTAQAG